MTPEDEALVRRVEPSQRGRNGIPSDEERARRERAAAVACGVLADVILPGGVRTSPLGPGWSRDLDLHVRRLPDPQRLEEHGWRNLDQLLARLGSSREGRWAIVEDDDVLGQADLHLGPPPDPVEALLARCRRRREVRLREVLELRALVRGGAVLPEEEPVVVFAARIEAGLGGDVLSRGADGPPLSPPAPLEARPLAVLRRLASAARRRYERRLTVAVSGVDGSGKSSLASALTEDLRALGLAASTVWTRPGMRLSVLDRVARTGKRLLRQPGTSGVGRIARGEGTAELRTRRGAIGWAWSLLVTLAFLRDVRRQWRAAPHVVVFDRHLLDALATLDVFYAGIDLRAHRALVRWLLPRADLTLYLQVSPEVAVARKPDDAFGDLVVRRQLERYEAWLPEIPGAIVLDASRPSRDLANQALRLAIGPGPRAMT